MRSVLKRFKKDKRGNFAMVVAIAFPAIFAGVALAVDMSESLRVRTELQNANDTAVLFATRFYQVNKRLPSINETRDFLESNFDRPILNAQISLDRAKNEVTLKSSAKAQPMLMNYFGARNQRADVVSKAALGVEGILEFALALDTTASMQFDGRIQGLKAASRDFINLLYDVKDRGAKVKGAIVPFARYVNVGISRRNEPWLQVPNDIDTRQTRNVCNTTTPVVGQTNVRQTCWPARTINHPAQPGRCYPAQPPSCYSVDGVQQCSGGRAAYCTQGSAAWTQNIPAGCRTDSDPVYGPPVTTCNQVTTGQLYTWQGCVGSRAHPKNVIDEFGNWRFPGVMTHPGKTVNCPTELIPLTDSRSALLSKVNQLSPQENTYIPDGVMWGSRILTKQAPFTEGESQANTHEVVRKALIIMTDGYNTVGPQGIYHEDKPSNIGDQLTREACQEAKDNDLEVYTVTFGTSVPNSIKTLMKECANKDEMYIHASSSAALTQAFQDIADKLLSVRLTH